MNIGGRIGREHSLVYEQVNILPNTKTGLVEIGYDYTISFRLEGANEKNGAILFSSPGNINRELKAIGEELKLSITIK